MGKYSWHNICILGQYEDEIRAGRRNRNVEHECKRKVVIQRAGGRSLHWREAAVGAYHCGRKLRHALDHGQESVELSRPDLLPLDQTRHHCRSRCELRHQAQQHHRKNHNYFSFQRTQHQQPGRGHVRRKVRGRRSQRAGDRLPRHANVQSHQLDHELRCAPAHVRVAR